MAANKAKVDELITMTRADLTGESQTTPEDAAEAVAEG